MIITMKGAQELAADLTKTPINDHRVIAAALNNQFPYVDFYTDDHKIKVRDRPKSTKRVGPLYATTDMVPAIMKYLEAAQAGDIKQIAIACLWNDGQYGYTVTEGPKLEMIGTIEHLKHDIMAAADD